MTKYEQVTLTTPDGVKVQAYVLLQGHDTDEHHTIAPKRPTILMLHANAGNMGHRLPLAKAFYRGLKMNVVLLSYRGYGTSAGSPTEKETALDHILSHPLLEKTRIILYGQSLGGAVAVNLAHQNQTRVSAVVLENTFWSIDKLVPRIMPYLTPFTLLLTEHWASGNLISHFRKDLPFLFISGKRDDLVPPEHMHDLFDACSSEAKIMKEFEDGTHNDTCTQTGYFEYIAFFLKTKLEKPKTSSQTLSPATSANVPLDDKLQEQAFDEDLKEMGAEAGSRVPPKI